MLAATELPRVGLEEVLAHPLAVVEFPMAELGPPGGRGRPDLAHLEVDTAGTGDLPSLQGSSQPTRIFGQLQLSAPAPIDAHGHVGPRAARIEDRLGVVDVAGENRLGTRSRSGVDPPRGAHVPTPHDRPSCA